jgi:hypothetical protein
MDFCSVGSCFKTAVDAAGIDERSNFASSWFSDLMNGRLLSVFTNGSPSLLDPMAVVDLRRYRQKEVNSKNVVKLTRGREMENSRVGNNGN